MQSMIAKIKNFNLVLSVIFISFFTLTPALALADNCDTNGDGAVSTQEAINCGAASASGSNQDSSKAQNNVNATIKTVINLLSIAVGVVAVIMVIVAGFRYVTSGGKQESVASAKNSLLYAIIGLVIVAFAQVIVRFVLFHVVKGK
jgi:hypothetical protein